MSHQPEKFTITRVDPLGQGVSLDYEMVTFIPKALPGETVLANVHQKKGKKVQFATLEKILEPSPQRIEPECPHFFLCPGCSFLNTNYEDEKKNKHAAYSFLFKKWKSSEEIIFHGSDQRLGYRNRMQLHFDQYDLGMRTGEHILPIPECKLPEKPIRTELQELYKEVRGYQRWKDFTETKEGHFELYLKGESVSRAVNQPYSHGGFTQVNQPIALAARTLIEEKIKKLIKPGKGVIDLFGGHGFLTENIPAPTLVVDFGADTSKIKNHQTYLDQNLYKKKAIKKLAAFIEAKKEWENPILILDPPRSGLKNISDFVEVLKPSAILYLSCNPHTQIRDLQELDQKGLWDWKDIHFFDFFPATHHLESFVHLEPLKKP